MVPPLGELERFSEGDWTIFVLISATTRGDAVARR
jgi:hypothetical protein